MRLLAFDLATSTGVAIGDARDAPLCHTERLGEAGRAHGARFSQAFHMASRLIKQHQPDLVAYEEPIASGVTGAQERVQLAMGLRACLLAVCHMRGVRAAGYHVSSVRKHFIGRGDFKRNDAKARTIARCRDFGWHVANDNEADACAVWEYARAMERLETTMPANGLFNEARGG